MANRASFVALHATTGLAGPLRVSLAYLSWVGGLPGPRRVSEHSLAWVGGMPGPKRIGDHFLAFTGGLAATAPIRASGHYWYVVQSVNNMFELERLESDSVIYEDGVGAWEVVLSQTIIPEHNPYRPRIPEALIDLGDDFYNFYEENQNILRQQHNITQAGDTTFPWQLFAETHSQKQYTLGSIGRFYHEDYGLIHARYVQFDFMVETTWPCAPVGLVKNKSVHEWTVTNRLDLSHADLVVGMTAQLTTPVDGEYGWVTVDGPNLQEIYNDSTTAEIGETLAWSQTGSVSNTAQGRTIGRRINKVGATETRLNVAQFYIQLESHSLAQIRQEVIEATDELADAILQLQQDVEVLKDLTDLDGTLGILQQKVTLLETRLNTEVRERKAADTAINNRISNLNFVTAGQLGAAVTALQNAIAAAQATLNTRINGVEAIALEALALAQSLTGGSDIEAQISLILNQIAELNSRPKNKFPVVDGSVPPNLVYLDDGSLVYVETP